MQDSFSPGETITPDPDYALFARIVAAGSLSAAGRAIGLSTAMVSKRLARLEARLGVQLVHRTTRRLALTGAGAAFHADVLAILAQIAAAEARLTGATGVARGSLRLSAPTSFGRLHVAPHLADFAAACPEVALEIDLTDSFVDLAAAKVDVAIRIAAELPRGLEAHRLGTSRRVLCASPAYLARAGAPVSIAALGGHRLLATRDQLPWRLARDGQQARVDGRSAVATDSSEIVRELALAGMGIALRSLWDVASHLDAGALVRVLPDWSGPADLGIYAIHPRAAIVPASVRAFVAFLRDRLAGEMWNR